MNDNKGSELLGADSLGIGEREGVVFFFSFLCFTFLLFSIYGSKRINVY